MRCRPADKEPGIWGTCSVSDQHWRARSDVLNEDQAEAATMKTHPMQIVTNALAAFGALASSLLSWGLAGMFG